MEKSSFLKKYLFLVLILSAFIIAGLGFLGFRNYTKTRTSVDLFMKEMSEVRSGYSVNQCRDHILNWYTKCDGIQVLCETFVIRATFFCLEGRKHPECVDVPDLYSSKEGFHDCVHERQAKGSFKKACGNVYQAISDYCHKRK